MGGRQSSENKFVAFPVLYFAFFGAAVHRKKLFLISADAQLQFARFAQPARRKADSLS